MGEVRKNPIFRDQGPGVGYAKGMY